PHLPLCDADLLGSLLLRDQFLLGLLQGHQPVSLGLGHQQLTFVHPPGWTLSIGHFYFAQIGHYYFAATRPDLTCRTKVESAGFAGRLETLTVCSHSRAGVAPGAVAQSRGDGVGSGSNRHKALPQRLQSGWSQPVAEEGLALGTTAFYG